MLDENGTAQTLHFFSGIGSRHASPAGIQTPITLQLGHDIMLATKARMRVSDRNGSANELIEAVNRVERELREKFPAVRWSFFEPDTKD